MKVQVIHDKRGNIESFGVPNKKFKEQVQLQPPPGKYVTEVEVPELKNIEGSGEDEHAKVRDLVKQSRIDTSREKPTLVKK